MTPNATLEHIGSIARTVGMIYAILVFTVAVAFAMWPSRKAEYEAIGRSPLDEE
ncbi:MAG: CcoQ/FixQ family Cbb3-type cytochrome c oxidase assembly chaperone [Hyphomicrobiales bacterium]|nr:CcoQ/FixQ family Cbb3-type cytochrome c oxidase assembly chaperone [Hyphomicrobiales bacterium]